MKYKILVGTSLALIAAYYTLIFLRFKDLVPRSQVAQPDLGISVSMLYHSLSLLLPSRYS